MMTSEKRGCITPKILSIRGAPRKGRKALSWPMRELLPPARMTPVTSGDRYFFRFLFMGVGDIRIRSLSGRFGVKNLIFAFTRVAYKQP